MLSTILQVGDAVEHRGIVIAPLFPRQSPVAGRGSRSGTLLRC